MNDPHVEALHYRIKHADSVDFDKASPLEHEELAFSVRIEKGHAKIVMKDHHPTTESARSVVEPFLRAWELKSALFCLADKFEFVFHNSDVIDRRPTPGALHAVGIAISSGVSFGIAHAHVGRARYPDPPVRLARDGNVDLMLDCYSMCCDGRSRLGDTAYFCLTVLERAAGGRRQAVQYFGIALPVLKTLGTLTDQKGGKEARKAKGAQNEFTNAERIWLQEVIKTMIRRAAEVAYDRSASRDQITMANLPPLA
jgi:hypothetical protein